MRNAARACLPSLYSVARFDFAQTNLNPKNGIQQSFPQDRKIHFHINSVNIHCEIGKLQPQCVATKGFQFCSSAPLLLCGSYFHPLLVHVVPSLFFYFFLLFWHCVSACVSTCVRARARPFSQHIKAIVTLSEETLLMLLIPCHQPICSLFSITGSQEK